VRLAIPILLSTAFAVMMTPEAKADFIADYATGNWTFINTNADGSVSTPDLGLSILLTGGNNGTGMAGTTDFLINSSGTGLVQFQWSYSSLDSTFAVCGPGFNLPCDNAGYLLGGVFTQLADDTNQISGITSFTVNSGDSFGFRVGTVDNSGEPGVFTVSNFSAPAGSVPEPGAAPVLLVAITAMLAAHRRVVRNRRVHIKNG
jgi:hypothetical protein